MGIFYKRPLCLFCFCFIGTSLVATALGTMDKLVLLCIGVVATAILFFLALKIRKRKYGLIEGAICTFFVAIALLLSLIAIDLPTKRLEEYTAKNAAIEYVVTEATYSSKYSTRYEGILLSTDKGKIGEKAYLEFSHEADYKAGDKLLLVGNISIYKDDTKYSFLPSEINLEISSTIDKDLVILKEFDGFSFSVTSAKLREYVRKIFCERLESDAAALSLGILTSNTSMISGEATRDFRRSGVSHLLAVSGLHLSLIVGVFNFLLMKLKLKKALRCIVTTVAALMLLTVASFSLSACRSVLMLLVAYLCYALSREPDTLTSLSVAGAVILFVSPVSVGSLSFWLSFLATLGIILYAELISTIRQRRYESKRTVINFILRIARNILSALTVTLSANVFICIIFWLFFGETSVISPIANLTVTVLGEVYLVLTILTLFFGNLYFLGDILCRLTSALASLMTSLAAYFSSLDFSVVSLRYAFAGIIIVTMTVILFILFTVKLKDKRWLFAPPTLALVSFCICILIYNAANTHVKAVYTSDSGRDSVAVADGDELLIIDVSDGSYSSLYNAYEWAKENAFAEVDTLLLTHYHAKHIPTLDKFFSRVIVNKVYIPEPKTSDEILILKDIARAAEEHGISLVVYEKQKLLEIDSYALFVPLEESVKDSSRKIISFALQTKEGLLYYRDSLGVLSDSLQPSEAFIKSADTLILGSHSPLSQEDGLNFTASSDKVIIADKEMYIRAFSFVNNQ